MIKLCLGVLLHGGLNNLDAPDDYTQTNFKNIMGAENYAHRLLGTMIRLCGDELLWKVHKM